MSTHNICFHGEKYLLDTVPNLDLWRLMHMSKVFHNVVAQINNWGLLSVTFVAKHKNITKTVLFKYTENFTTKNMKIFR